MIDINKAMIDVSESKQELNEKLGTAINLEVNTNELKNAIKAQQDTYNQLVQKLADYQKNSIHKYLVVQSKRIQKLGLRDKKIFRNSHLKYIKHPLS